MIATKIKMKAGCNASYNLLEIDKIYLKGVSEEGFYPKAIIHDYLKQYPEAHIEVNIYPYPKLEPVVSQNGEKYVRSKANTSFRDNLLNLPRE